MLKTYRIIPLVFILEKMEDVEGC